MLARKLVLKSGLFIAVSAGVMGLMAATMPNDAPVFHLDKSVTVNGQKLDLELAETNAQVTEGLSDRLSMKDDQGMLFLVGDAGVYPFWMNRMHFPLDIIWIKDGQVVEIAADLPPPTKTHGIPVTYTPKAEANEVLEITAGGAERYGLKIGSQVDF